MAYSNQPKRVNLAEMEKKLRELGIDSDINHLSEKDRSKQNISSPAPVSTPVPAQQTARVETSSQSTAMPSFGDERSVSDWCNYVFGTLLSIYESTWVQSYGRRPTGRFLDFADSTSEPQLMRIIQHCRERLQGGDRWPPIMGELVVLKDLPTESELNDALSRVIAKEPADELETWLMQNKYYELRRLPENTIASKFKDYYRQAMKLQESGRLDTAPLALPTHSVKSVTDLKREEFEQQHGKQLHPKIQAILNTKK